MAGVAGKIMIYHILMALFIKFTSREIMKTKCDVKNWLIGKDPDAGKDWRWEEKGTTEDEMVGWHHWLNGDGFE